MIKLVFALVVCLFVAVKLGLNMLDKAVKTDNQRSQHWD